MNFHPSTPKANRKEKFGFAPQPMVAWFDPGQLVRTGLKAMLSAIFGAYADKREVQAALQHLQPSEKSMAGLSLRDPFPYDDLKEIWIDFIADVGDGWDSTYGMAWLLSRDKLPLKEKNREALHSTQRGRILIMGGDEVYPTAKREEYQNRLVGPYESALPALRDEKLAPKKSHDEKFHDQRFPHLYAIPGNHDWYDGLTAFTRLFMQQRTIGRWCTQQTRSYFAIRLPNKWWLWGIDIQLDADIDKPQLDYFKGIAEKHMKDGGHKIILCTGEPSWVRTHHEGAEAYHNLDYFERKTIRECGNQVMLTLTGDLHHYSRYEHEENGHKQHKITAGGGGAYLYGTHQLPDTLKLIESKSKRADDDESAGDEKGTPKTYSLRSLYPGTVTSKFLTLRCLALPFQNPTFGAFMAAIYLVYAWVVQGASYARGISFMDEITSSAPNLSGLGEVCTGFFDIIKYSPTGVILFLIIVGGLIGYCSARKMFVRIIVGSLHAAVHLVLNILLIWIFAYLNPKLLGTENLPSQFELPQHLLLFSAEMLVIGGIAGGLVMGFYLVLSDLLLGFHINEVFSSQHRTDYKNFLRLHIDQQGKLTVYPIGVDRACTKWEEALDLKNGASRFTPRPGNIEAVLIEAPISI